MLAHEALQGMCCTVSHLLLRGTDGPLNQSLMHRNKHQWKAQALLRGASALWRERRGGGRGKDKHETGSIQ